MLQRDAEGLLRVAFKAKVSCSKLEAVETEAFPGTTSTGVSRERWTAIGCGKRMSVDFTFTPDGKGGTYISFKAKEIM